MFRIQLGSFGLTRTESPAHCLVQRGRYPMCELGVGCGAPARLPVEMVWDPAVPPSIRTGPSYGVVSDEASRKMDSLRRARAARFLRSVVKLVRLPTASPPAPQTPLFRAFALPGPRSRRISRLGNRWIPTLCSRGIHCSPSPKGAMPHVNMLAKTHCVPHLKCSPKSTPPALARSLARVINWPCSWLIRRVICAGFNSR